MELKRLRVYEDKRPGLGLGGAPAARELSLEVGPSEDRARPGERVQSEDSARRPSRTPQGNQSKYWCFTKHFGTMEELEKTNTGVDEMIDQLDSFDDKMKKLFEKGSITYVVYQLEKGKKTGRLHLQGYIEFAKRLRMTAITKLVGFQCHWAKRLGTAVQASNYCKKGDDLPGGRFMLETRELGTLSTEEDGPSLKGQMIKAMKEGKTELEIMDEFTPCWMANHNAVKKFIAAHPKKEERKDVGAHCFWGPPGTGKSTKCAEIAGQAEAKGYKGIYYKDASKWWPKYNGEEIVIFEEFPKEPELAWDVLLRLTDPQPRGDVQCDQKGGDVTFRGRLMLFNSNLHPRDWYPKQAEKSALLRRFKTIELMKEVWQKTDENGDFVVKDKFEW